MKFYLFHFYILTYLHKDLYKFRNLYKIFHKSYILYHFEKNLFNYIEKKDHFHRSF